MPIPLAVTAAMGGIGQLLSAFGIGNNPEEWKQDAIMSLWNRAQQGDEMARSLWSIMADPARQNALNIQDTVGQNAIDQAPWLYQAMQNMAGGIPGEIDNALGKAYGEDAQGYNAGVLGGVDRTNQIGDIASQLFAGGGWTPQSQELFDTLGAYMRGQGSNTQLALGDVAPSLLSQRGQTAYTQGMLDRATDAAQSRGLSPDLQFAIDRAKDTLATGGYSDANARQSRAGFDILGSAAGKALGNTLLSPEAAANWAREESANQYASQLEAAQRQSQARGSAPGVLLGAGQKDNFQAQFADAALRAATEAARKGFSDQETKGLQDKSIAAGLASVGSGLTQDAEQSAIARQGQAYSAIPGTSNAATAVMSALLGAGGDANSNEVARMGAGTQMAQALLGSQSNAASQYGSTLANQNQYALGAGSLANQSSSQNSTAYNNAFGNRMAAGQLGNQYANTQLGAQNQAYSNLSTLLGQFFNANQNAQNNLTTLAGQGMDYAGRYVGLMGAPFANIFGNQGYQGNPTPWGAIGSGLGGILGKLPIGGSGPGNGDFGGEVSH